MATATKDQAVKDAQNASVRVEIFDQAYNLRGSDPEYILKLAEYVDSKMRAVAEATNTIDTVRLAVLAALNIADEYHLLKKKQDSGATDYQKRAHLLADALDEVLRRKPQGGLVCARAATILPDFCAARRQRSSSGNNSPLPNQCGAGSGAGQRPAGRNRVRTAGQGLRRGRRWRRATSTSRRSARGPADLTGRRDPARTPRLLRIPANAGLEVDARSAVRLGTARVALVEFDSQVELDQEFHQG